MGRDQGFCGLRRAEAGLKDWADAGMARRVCKALRAGGWEAQVGQRLGRLAEQGVAGSRPEMEAGRGKVQQVSKPARGGKEGGTESASRLSTWVRSLAGGRAGARAGQAGHTPVFPHGGAHGLAWQ